MAGRGAPHGALGAGAAAPLHPLLAPPPPSAGPGGYWGDLGSMDLDGFDALLSDAFQFGDASEAAAGLATLFPPSAPGALPGRAHPDMLGDLRFVHSAWQEQDTARKRRGGGEGSAGGHPPPPPPPALPPALAPSDAAAAFAAARAAVIS